MTGIEPGTNYPNPRSFEGEQGRVTKLQGRARAEFDFRLSIHTEAKEIALAEKRIAQMGGETTIHDSPQQGWCSDA